MLRLQSQLCRPAVGGRTCGPGPSTQARHSPDHRSRGGAWGRYPTLPTDLANGNAAQRKITQKQAHVRTLAWRAAKATCSLSLISDHGPHTHTCPARPAEGRAHAGMTWSPLPWAPGQKRGTDMGGPRAPRADPSVPVSCSSCEGPRLAESAVSPHGPSAPPAAAVLDWTDGPSTVAQNTRTQNGLCPRQGEPSETFSARRNPHVSVSESLKESVKSIHRI